MKESTIERCIGCKYLDQYAGLWYCDKFDVPSTRLASEQTPIVYELNCKEVIQ